MAEYNATIDHAKITNAQRLMKEGFTQSDCMEVLQQFDNVLEDAARELFGNTKYTRILQEPTSEGQNNTVNTDLLENFDDETNYYAVLGIPKDKATKQVVKKSYYKLALKYHPDRNSDPDAGRKFKIVRDAYEVLVDPERKNRYDINDDGTILADSKLLFSKMFGSLAFVPYIGETKMGFHLKRPQAKDVVEQVRQEYEYNQYLKNRPEELSHFLIQRVETLLEKCQRDPQEYLKCARALRNELRQEVGSDELLKLIGWCYSNIGLKVYENEFGSVLGRFTAIYRNLKHYASLSKSTFKSIGHVYQTLLQSVTAVADAKDAEDLSKTEQAKLGKQKVLKEFKNVLWGINEVDILKVLGDVVDKALESIEDKFHKKYICEAVILLGEVFLEPYHPVTKGDVTQLPMLTDGGQANPAHSQSSSVQQLVKVPENWLTMERSK